MQENKTGFRTTVLLAMAAAASLLFAATALLVFLPLVKSGDVSYRLPELLDKLDLTSAGGFSLFWLLYGAAILSLVCMVFKISYAKKFAIVGSLSVIYGLFQTFYGVFLTTAIEDSRCTRAYTAFVAVHFIVFILSIVATFISEGALRKKGELWYKCISGVLLLHVLAAAGALFGFAAHANAIPPSTAVASVVLIGAMLALAAAAVAFFLGLCGTYGAWWVFFASGALVVMEIIISWFSYGDEGMAFLREAAEKIMFKSDHLASMALMAVAVTIVFTIVLASWSKMLSKKSDVDDTDESGEEITVDTDNQSESSEEKPDYAAPVQEKTEDAAAEIPLPEEHIKPDEEDGEPHLSPLGIDEPKTVPESPENE